MKKTLRSTSFKLLAFYAISCILIIFIVQTMTELILDYTEQKVQFRNQNRIRYSQLLAKDLEGSKNFREDSLRLEKDLAINVRIEDFHGNKLLATPGQSGSLDDIEKTGLLKTWTPDIKTGVFQKVAFTVITLDDRLYLFQFHAAAFQEMRLQWLWPMMALIVLILLANFALIRWLFKPVAWLSEGIHKLGEGDFDVQVPCRSHDELGDLAQSFNQTVERVRHIVESKRQLLLDVSHELRTPLTRIKVALELESAKAKDHVRRNILVLESMIHDLLESARLESSQPTLPPERLNLTEVLNDVVSSVQSEKPGVVIKNSDETFFTTGDRKQIEICLKNVLDNGLKYSNFQTKPVEITVSGNPDDSHWKVCVKDFGIGIPESETEKIFEAFYQIDKSRTHKTGGYGLGLSLCRKIMTAHGGKVFVKNPPPVGATTTGSTFVLEFPVNTH